MADEGRPALCIIPNVELLHVGDKWPLMSDGTEDGTFTPEDLAAAVAAVDDPSVRSPVVSFGHTAGRAGKLTESDAAPVWGRATNLRLANEGMTLTCDLAGVPVWLAEILPSAWPSRSIEGRRNTPSDLGHVHAMRIDAVKFLGVRLPAISTLAEVRAVWSARTPEEANVTLQEDTMTTTPTPTAAARRPATVTASTTDEDIRRAYYDTLPAGAWSPWIRRVQIDPLALIVDDDDGHLWRVPFTVAGDVITFGAAEAVVEEYVAVAASRATSASPPVREAIVFASRDESLRGVADMPDLAALRTRLGLADDVSDDEVLAAALAAVPEPTATGTPATPATPPAAAPATATGSAQTPATAVAPTPPVTPTPTPTADADGSVRISQAVLDELQANAAMGVAASRRQAKDDEDGFIARHRPRLGPASNPKAARLEQSWRREYQRNPGEAEALAASHAVVMPTTEALGHEGGAEDPGGVDWDAFERGLSTDVAASRATRDGKAGA